MKRNRALAFVLALLASAGVSRAATETYKIDPAHSNVGFTIRHFFSKVPGKFKTFDGTITMDPKDLSTAVVSVTIDTASIDTGVEDRDKHLRSADFFDADKNPKITFTSTGVVPKGTTKATLKGDLTMKGTSKPVTMEVEVLGFAADPWGHYRGGFEAKTTLNRQDFGISWNKALEGGGTLLGNDVEILLDVEAVRQEAPKPSGEAPKKN